MRKNDWKVHKEEIRITLEKLQRQERALVFCTMVLMRGGKIGAKEQGSRYSIDTFSDTVLSAPVGSLGGGYYGGDRVSKRKGRDRQQFRY
mgnify:CR=1 FL=1